MILFIAGTAFGLVCAAILTGTVDMFYRWREERKARKRWGNYTDPNHYGGDRNGKE